MKRATLFVLLCAAVLVLVGPVSAHAANADCVACHAAGGAAFSRVDFTSGVDYARCRACHWPAPADYVGNYRHAHGPDQSRTCASCHLGSYQTLDPTRVGTVMTPYGYFNSAASTSMTPAAIHSAHINGSWEGAGGLTVTDECQSCHKPASCGACHAAPLAHADHTKNASTGVYAYPPVTIEVGGGTPEGVRYVRNVFTAQQTCTNAACHDPGKAATADFIPACVSCHPTKAAAHGYDPVQHTSSWTMSAGCITAGCHTSRILWDEHLARRATFTCATCHSSTNPAVAAAIAAKDTACGSCHPAISATDGHRGQHLARPALTNADGSGNYAYYTGSLAGTKTADCGMCHSSNVVDAHLGVVTTAGVVVVPGQKDSTGAPLTCATCHASVSAAVINAIATHQTACDSCHTIHGPIGAVHATTYTAAPAVPCGACHAGRLDDAHAAASTVTSSGVTLNGCALCHGYYEGARGQRIQSAISVTGDTRCTACHDAIHADTTAAHTTTATAIGTLQCADCHGTVTAAGVDVKGVHAGALLGACKVCHENSARVPNIAAKTPACASCHALTTIHAAAAAKHSSTSTQCAGAGCHAIGDVSTLHSAASTTAAGVTYTGCRVCHRPGVTLTTATCSLCHPSVTGNHHASHDTSAAIDAGCDGCHFRYLDDEHAKLGYTCATCHASTKAAVVAAIAGHKRACDACHPAVNGRDRHASQDATEFVAANYGGHRAYAAMSGQRSSFFVNGAVYTWPAPAASSFLKSGWTNNSIVTCDNCHTYSGASGPHGSSVAVNIDPAYSTAWETAYLTDTGVSSSSVLCAKCHTNLQSANSVHSSGDHHSSSTGKCVFCHPGVPHGWRLPRMLSYTSDPAPYASTGLRAIKLRSYSSTRDWSSSDCGSSCGEHNSMPSPVWPATVQVSGSITGTVKDASGLAVSGATVTLSTGATDVTDSSGRYDFAMLAAGSVTLTATKAGYTTSTKTVTVVGNQTAIADVTIAPLPVNLALGRSFSASHYESYSYQPSMAGDGSTATWWWSDHSGYSTSSEWLKVDLGSSKSASSVEIAWYDGCWAKDYRIYVSTDNVNWTQVYATSYATSGGVKTHSFTTRSVRYVRVDCRATSGSNTGYAIAELRVYQ